MTTVLGVSCGRPEYNWKECKDNWDTYSKETTLRKSRKGGYMLDHGCATDEIFGQSSAHLETSKKEKAQTMETMYEGRAGLRSWEMPAGVLNSAGSVRIMDPSPQTAKRRADDQRKNEDAGKVKFRPVTAEAEVAQECIRQQMFIPCASSDRRRQPGVAKVDGGRRDHVGIETAGGGSLTWRKLSPSPAFDGHAGRPSDLDPPGRFHSELFLSREQDPQDPQRGVHEYIRFELDGQQHYSHEAHKTCENDIDELAKSRGRKTFHASPFQMATGVDKTIRGEQHVPPHPDPEGFAQERSDLYGGGAGIKTWDTERNRCKTLVRNDDGVPMRSLHGYVDTSPPRAGRRPCNELYVQTQMAGLMVDQDASTSVSPRRPTAVLEGHGLPSGYQLHKLIERKPKPCSQDVDWNGVQRSTVPLGGPTVQSLGAPTINGEFRNLVRGSNTAPNCRCPSPRQQQRSGHRPPAWRSNSAGPSYGGGGGGGGDSLGGYSHGYSYGYGYGHEQSLGSDHGQSVPSGSSLPLSSASWATAGVSLRSGGGGGGGVGAGMGVAAVGESRRARTPPTLRTASTPRTSSSAFVFGGSSSNAAGGASSFCDRVVAVSSAVLREPSFGPVSQEVGSRAADTSPRSVRSEWRRSQLPNRSISAAARAQDHSPIKPAPQSSLSSGSTAASSERNQQRRLFSPGPTSRAAAGTHARSKSPAQTPKARTRPTSPAGTVRSVGIVPAIRESHLLVSSPIRQSGWNGGSRTPRRSHTQEHVPPSTNKALHGAAGKPCLR